MHEHVDFEHLDFGQGAREADLFLAVLNAAADGAERGFGLGREARQQGRQSQAGGERLLDIGARGIDPFVAVDAFELGAQIGRDRGGELLDLGIVEALAEFGRTRILAPEFARNVEVERADHRP